MLPKSGPGSNMQDQLSVPCVMLKLCIRCSLLHQFFASFQRVKTWPFSLASFYTFAHLNQSPQCLSVWQVLLIRQSLFKILNKLKSGSIASELTRCFGINEGSICFIKNKSNSIKMKMEDALSFNPLTIIHTHKKILP